jgi:histidinol-phosphate aminotransferase
VRPFNGDGVRVSIDEPAANDRFLEVAAAWRSR